ncbi:FHA domain-containing protein [Kallotenue papyrolyticum]|uniref:FHA domain-containing protein n=1 Tax=Kallotenue papyrolyticum TaxID=1325125 RepID=UPI00047859C8|nr:FHA domain-containing protein [Kallotenue papyrolyticum]
MLVCRNCQTHNLQGTIFCEQCGESLLPHERRRDTTHVLGARPAPPPAQRSRKQTAPLTNGQRRLRATILNNGRRIDLPLETPILVGRQDSARGFFPDLDLTHDGGYDCGVSRRHARITLQDDVAYVEDLESANGSFLNNQRLPPRAPQPLKAGDELRLGSLIMRIDQT